MINLPNRAPAQRLVPMQVPVAGYSGGDPVRAFQGMAGAMRGSGQTNIGALMYGANPGAGTPIDTSQTFVNQHLAPPAEKVRIAETAFLPASMPSLSQGIQQAGATHSPGATVGGVSSAVNPNSGTLSGVASPVNAVPNMSTQTAEQRLVSAVQRAGMQRPAGYNTSGVGGALSGNSLAGAKSPVASTPSMAAPTANASSKLAGTAAFSAADPNRALKMMRGY